MQRVFVLSNNKKALMPCHPAKARHGISRQTSRFWH